jgi:hypothetical protein
MGRVWFKTIWVGVKGGERLERVLVVQVSAMSLLYLIPL